MATNHIQVKAVLHGVRIVCGEDGCRRFLMHGRPRKVLAALSKPEWTGEAPQCPKHPKGRVAIDNSACDIGLSQRSK